MSQLERFKAIGYRIQPEPGKPVNLLDLLEANLSEPTLLVIESDLILEAALTVAEESANEERRNTIANIAGALPEDDPLRIAIELAIGG